jgi:hypothetical protein
MVSFSDELSGIEDSQFGKMLILQCKWQVCIQTNGYATAHAVWKHATSKSQFLGTSPYVWRHPSMQLGWTCYTHIYNDANFVLEHLTKHVCLVKSGNKPPCSVICHCALCSKCNQNMLCTCNRPHVQWHKITMIILNYDIIQLFALVELVEYQKRENTDVPVPNTVSEFHMHSNIQKSAACRSYWTTQ